MTSDIANDIKSNPLIYKLFNDSDTQEGDFSTDINWVKIPSGDSSITLMSVKVYSYLECIDIQRSLNVENGKDICFTNEGHIGTGYFKNGRLKNFYKNPVNNKNSEINNRPSSKSNTIYNKVLQKWNKSFFYNEDFLFSPNLLWILYKLPNQRYGEDGKINYHSGTNTVPAYVLLYNPIHRKDFQKVYSNILNLTKNEFSTENLLGSDTDYKTTIGKYCNAFKMKKYVSPSSGNEIEHYLDPTCCLNNDHDLAKMSFVLNMNITKNSVMTDYYKNGIDGYNAVYDAFNSIDLSSPYCGEGSGHSPASYVREFDIVGPNPSSSFMQQLTNFIIYKNAKGKLTLPQNWNEAKPSESNNGIRCATRSLNITQCNNNIIGDKITLDNTSLSNVCGATSKDSKTDSTVSKTDPLVPKTDPSVPKTDPSVPKTDPSVPKTDPLVPKTDPSVPKTDPSVPKTDPSVPKTDPSVNLFWKYLIALIILLLILLIKKYF